MHVDASAAKSIVERSRLDRVRHIDVNVLWLREQEIRGRAPLSKVDGSDLMTKNVDAKKCEEHMTRMSVTFRTGRSEKTSNLYLVDIWDARRAIHEITTPDKVSHFIGLKKEAKHLSSKVFWRRTRDAETESILMDAKGQ